MVPNGTRSWSRLGISLSDGGATTPYSVLSSFFGLKSWIQNVTRIELDPVGTDLPTSDRQSSAST